MYLERSDNAAKEWKYPTFIMCKDQDLKPQQCQQMGFETFSVIWCNKKVAQLESFEDLRKCN